MEIVQIKHVVEVALLAAGRPLPFDTLAAIFSAKASEVETEMLAAALDELAADYAQRGLELKEVASGYRIQIRSSMSDWLVPLWEERAPRYTRALLETLALIAYRQPVTRAEIEDVRGVAVSTNIVRTLLERKWIRVVGHRDVPGKPAMFGTTRDFLDYFGLRKLDELPPLADVKDGLPEESPQTDLVEVLAAVVEGADAVEVSVDDEVSFGAGEVVSLIAQAAMAEGPDTEGEVDVETEPDFEADLEVAIETTASEEPESESAELSDTDRTELG